MPAALAREVPCLPHVKTPWWLWPNILALDAPVVAILWQSLFAHTLHQRPSFVDIASLALVCWLIYATDYLADGRSRFLAVPVTQRHQFFRRHRSIILGVIIAALVALIGLVPTLSPIAVSKGIVLGLVVLFYLAVTHLRPASWRSHWPRELAVAVIFAAGTSLTIEYASFQYVVETAIFAVLCWMNMSAIEYWEWRKLHNEESPAPPVSTRWVASNLSAVSGAIIVAVLLSQPPATFEVCVVLSCLSFVLLGRKSRVLSAPAVRVAADLALCTPIIALIARRLL